MRTSFTDLHAEAQAIQDFLEDEIPEDIVVIERRGSELSVYYARTGKMLADAKYWLSMVTKEAAEKVVTLIKGDVKLSAKVQNAIVDSDSPEYIYLVDWIERLNKACKQQAGWCQTLSANARAERELSRFHN